jgi:DNA-binding MarR family transcriptional regulator
VPLPDELPGELPEEMLRRLVGGLTFIPNSYYFASMQRRLHRTETGYLLNKAARRWNTLFVKLLRQQGVDDIRPSFGAVLVPLFEENGLRLGELCQRSGLTKQTMTSLVHRIEQLGYVERRADPEDGRAVQLHLTARARKVEPLVESVLDQLDRTTSALSDACGLAADSWLDAVSKMR